MDNIEMVAFNIISNVGMAKSLAMESLREVRKGNYELSEEKMKEAENFLIEGHHAHAELIQKEAAGEKLEFSLLILHAEDQMMSAETIKELAKEMIAMYKKLKGDC